MYPELVDPRCIHVFSGACDWGVTVDFRKDSNAMVVADYTGLPFSNDSMSCGIADPPYADHWQGQWHGELPKPKWILKEMCRVVKTGGIIGILYIIVIPAYKELGVERIALHPVLCGPNNAIRVFNVFRKVK